MPFHKQPETLVVLSMCSIGDFVKNFLHQFIEETLQPHDWNTLHYLMQHCLPQHLANKMMDHLLKIITEVLENTASAVLIESNHDTLMNMVVNPGISELVLDHCSDNLCLALCRQLYRLTELRVLTLPRISVKDMKQSIQGLIEHSFVSCSNLTVFSYEKNCTDEMLAVLSEHCKQLKQLHVAFSKKVTSESVTYIGKLQELRILDVWGTFISRDYCCELLNELPNLENFSSDNIPNILKGFNRFPLTLKSITTLQPISVHCLVNTCPGLTQMTLYAVRCDLSDLKILTDLRYLTVSTCNFSILHMFLFSRGKQLKSLELTEVSEVDMSVISCCVQLTKLHLSLCSFTAKHYRLQDYLSSPHFEHVEHLYLSHYTIMDFDVLLSAYGNLRILHLSSISILNTEIIAAMAKVGKLRQLEDVCYENCGRVNIDIFICLVDFCPALRRITYKGMMYPAEDEISDLYDLDVYFKENNLDIHLSLTN